MAIACGTLAGMVVCFWLARIALGAARADRGLVMGLAYFGAVALSFFARPRLRGEAFLVRPFFLVFLMVFAVRFMPGGDDDLGLLGAVTFAIAIGLVTAGAVLDYRRLDARAAVSVERRQELEGTLRRSRDAVRLLAGLALACALAWLALRRRSDTWSWIALPAFGAASIVQVYVVHLYYVLRRIGGIEAQ